MIPYSELITYMAVVLGLFLIPGPAVLVILTRTSVGGRKTGFQTALGVSCGDLVHVLGATAGLTTLLMTSAFFFNLVKYAGTAYLVYLGLKAFAQKPADPARPEPRPLSTGQAFYQGFLIETLNPKTALFFLAFLPQFVHPERGPVLGQLISLGLIFFMLSLVYCCLLVWSFRALKGRLRKPAWLGPWQGKITGTIFIVLGLKVATQNV